MPSPSSSSPPNPISSDPNSGPLYFWRPGEPTTGFLSQWRSSSATRRSRKPYWRCSPAPSPQEVKSLGRAVRNFDQAVWERERERIVREGNWCKFNLPIVEEEEEEEEEEGTDKSDGKEGERVWSLGDHEDAPVMRAASFRDVLLATGTRELVEASPFDHIWGIGFGAKDAGNRRSKWGLNLLGKCLMEVREEFRREEALAAGVESGEQL
ncbi:hypothetical protein F4782DRAFT_545423 [Xylaria castorea]|nr:hypothetical protein F4782DRAFT_545423 [Xylaria castorea]